MAALENRPSLAEIIRRVENGAASRVLGKSVLLRRSMIYVLVRVFAGLMHGAYGSLEFLRSALFLTTARGEWLTRRARELGTTAPLGPTRAAGSVIFFGTTGALIPVGQQLTRSDGALYEVTEARTIAGSSVEVPVRALVAGSAGNATGTGTLVLTDVLPGIESVVTITEAGIKGGSDAEDEEKFRERALAERHSPALGGSKDNYVNWARSVPGVGNAFVFSNYEHMGPGTVLVLLVSADPEFPDPSASVVDAVAAYIETQRPVTAEVTYAGVSPVPVTLRYRITPFNPGVVAAARSALREWFRSRVKARMLIRLTELSAVMANAGVADNQILEIRVGGISKPLTNIQLVGREYPVLESDASLVFEELS